MIYYDIVV